MTNNVTGHSST